MGDKNADSRFARRNMLKTFITHAMKSKDDGNKKIFSEYVQDISDAQSTIVKQMASGEKPEGIEIDPRTQTDEFIAVNKEPVEKSDVKDEIGKFRQRQKTQKEAQKK